MAIFGGAELVIDDIPTGCRTRLYVTNMGTTPFEVEGRHCEPGQKVEVPYWHADKWLRLMLPSRSPSTLTEG